MLVLSRKRNEGLVIGNGLVVNVVDIRGDYVRLAIEAPQTLSVHRGEVREALRRVASETVQPVDPMDKIHG